MFYLILAALHAAVFIALYLYFKRGYLFRHRRADCLWLDDERDPPEGYTWVKTYDECIAHLATGKVKVLSLDHDLGTIKTGYDVCVWMAEFGFPDTVYVHSANAVGRQNMISVIKRYHQDPSMYWKASITPAPPKGESWIPQE